MTRNNLLPATSHNHPLDKSGFLRKLSSLAASLEQSNDHGQIPPLRLRSSLDALRAFIARREHEDAWRRYGDRPDVACCAERLRDCSMRAVCALEKYESASACNGTFKPCEYLSSLTGTVSDECMRCGIDEHSKVLVVGAGALPLTTLSIARATGAVLLGLDIDEEAVRMAERVGHAAGLGAKVSFSSLRAYQLPLAQEATHAIVASLVPNKSEVLQELKSVLPPQATVVVRYGNGLKSVFNYPMESVKKEDWVPASPPTRGSVYDAVTLRRANANG